MTTATASGETPAPARKSARPNLRVVPADDIETMTRDIEAEVKHLRPAITRHSVDLDRLRRERKDRIDQRDALIEKKALVLSLVETFGAAIDDEIADAERAIALYSGIGETV